MTYDKQTFDLIRKIYYKTNVQGVLDEIKFKDKLDSFIKENNKLKLENAILRKETNDDDFSVVLANANLKLEKYDIEGYNDILEIFKSNKKRELGKLSYLQAQNSHNAYNDKRALLQINEALEFDNGNPDLLLLKAKILEALLRFDDSLEIYFTIINLGIDNATLLSCNEAIGIIYKEKLMFDSALTYFEKALSNSKKMNTDSVLVAGLYNHIGSVYFAMGDYNKAQHNYKRGLLITQEVFGVRHPSLLNLYNNLGTVFQERKEFNNALKYFQMAVDITEKQLGKEHPSLAPVYGNIGQSYSDSGDYDNALEFCKKGLNIRLKMFGNDHAKISTCYNNLGLIYKRKGEFKNALECFEKSISLVENTRLAYYPNVASTYNNIGSVFEKRDENETALKYFRIAEKIFIKAVGSSHPNIAVVYDNMALIYKKKGDYKRSKEYFEKALMIYKKVFGIGHQSSRNASKNLLAVSKINGKRV